MCLNRTGALTGTKDGLGCVLNRTIDGSESTAGSTPPLQLRVFVIVLV